MLTSPPTLYTRRPSPTTIEYTVSTHPPLTLPLRILLLLTHILRIILGLLILILLYTTYSPFLALPSLSAALPSPITSLMTPLLPTFSTLPPYTPLLTLPLLYLLLLRPHTSESLLLLRHLGLQISSSPSTYLSTTKTRFIPTGKIQDMYINEVFKGLEVRYVLVVVVEGEGELVVVFERLLPGRRVLEKVWRGGRRGLFGGDDGGKEVKGRDGGKDGEREKVKESVEESV